MLIREREIVVAIDTREQRPYRFARSEVRRLETGDYSVVGLEDRVAIERKSLPDAYGCIGHDRERFQRELERLAVLDYAAIVIESSLRGFLQPPPFSKLHPRSALCSVLAWSVRYRIPVFFADDREHGAALTYRLLQYFVRYRGAVAEAQPAAETNAGATASMEVLTHGSE